MKDMSAQKQVCSIGTGGESAEALRERSWEYGLPPYLQHDLDAYKEGFAEGSSLRGQAGSRQKPRGNAPGNYRLQPYFQHDLDAYKEGFAEGSSLRDCLWEELYRSINIAEINDGAITHEHANYLRQKFLWGE